MHPVFEAAEGQSCKLLQSRVLDTARSFVVAERYGALEDTLVVGEEHPSLADGEGLARHARHRGHVPQCPGQPSLVETAVRVADVLDYLDPVPGGDIHQGVHIGHKARVVDGHDGLRPVGNLALDIGRIKREVVLQYVGEDDRGPQVHGRHEGGPVRGALRYELVAGAEPTAEHRGVKRRRP